MAEGDKNTMDLTIFDALTRTFGSMSRPPRYAAWSRARRHSRVALPCWVLTPSASAKAAPTHAAAGRCPRACSDGLRNGRETDVDCGGGTCPRCASGKTCASRSDCASALCTTGTCQQCAARSSGTDAGGKCVPAGITSQGSASAPRSTVDSSGSGRPARPALAASSAFRSTGEPGALSASCPVRDLG